MTKKRKNEQKNTIMNNYEQKNTKTRINEQEMGHKFITEMHITSKRISELSSEAGVKLAEGEPEGSLKGLNDNEIKIK